MKKHIWKNRLWIISSLIFLGLIIPWFHPIRRWEIYTSIGTIGAVFVALFSGEIQAFLHSPDMEIQISNELFDHWRGMLWVRGRVVNNGDVTAKACVIKAVSVTGQSDQYTNNIEGGFLNWRGGDAGPVDIYPKDSFIFDIGSRQENSSTSGLELNGQIMGNEVGALVLAPGECKFSIRLYGDNFRFISKAVLIKIGKTSEDIKISSF